MRTSPLARVLLVAAAYPWFVCARDSITVAVANYAAAPSRVVEYAAEAARRAFLSAGIDSHWVICAPENCRRQIPAGTRYLELLVMPRLLRPLDDAPLTHPAGFALSGIPRPRAWVLYDEAEFVSMKTLRPLYSVLGCIFVHETGHLLGLHHQPRGAMRSSLQRNDMDETTRGQGFSLEERKQLREAVRLMIP